MNWTIFTRRAALAALMGCAALPSWALDYSGYFRAGPGSASENRARSCYGLSGPGLKYRLGNECDIFGEFQVSQPFSKDGVDYKATLMPTIYNNGTDSGDESFKLAQMYAEARGFDVFPQATFWIGKRYYGRTDVHIVDTFFVKMDGVGGGVDDIPVGPGKLSASWFRDDGTDDKAGNRFNLDYKEIPVNPGGTLRFVGSAVRPSFTGGANGLGLTVQHNQLGFPFAGAKNTLWLQTSRGSAGLDGNFGNLLAKSSDKSVRVVESFTWQNGAFGTQAMGLVQQDRPESGGKVVSTSLGGRVSYAFTKNFKLLAELGNSMKRPDAGGKQRLTKFTIAPTLSTGPALFDRPEFRFYVTHGRWNDAAGADAANNLPTGKTSDTSVGLQVEIWF